MAAQATTHPLVIARAGQFLRAKIIFAAAGSLLAMLTLAGAFICLRRASGALTAPLPAPVLASLGGLLALAAAGFRAALPSSIWCADRRTLYATWATPSAVLALWAAGLSLGETSAAGLIALWGLLVGEEVWSWTRLMLQNPFTRMELGTPLAAATTTTPSNAPRAGVAVFEESDEQVENISQQFVRRCPPEGGEMIEGWVRAEFLPGQRNGAAHIAICPPFDRVPRCFAEQMDGPPAHIKIGQALAYGVRFEIKLDQPTEEATSVIVEFSVQDTPPTE